MTVDEKITTNEVEFKTTAIRNVPGRERRRWRFDRSRKFLEEVERRPFSMMRPRDAKVL